MKMKKRKLIISGFIVIALLMTIMILVFSNGLEEVINLSIDSVDLSKIEDGVYTGTYDFKRWTNTVRVHVSNHTITKIEIVSDVFGGGFVNCSDEVIRRVIEAQNTDVDAVTGATVTTNAYLKAIENALKENSHE